MEYNFGQAPAISDYSVEPDSDPKVKSHLSVVVDGTSEQTQYLPRNWLRIDYNFDPGWKFLRLAPHGKKQEPLAGKPTGLFGRMWVNGDGSNQYT